MGYLLTEVSMCVCAVAPRSQLLKPAGARPLYDVDDSAPDLDEALRSSKMFYFIFLGFVDLHGQELFVSLVQADSPTARNFCAVGENRFGPSVDGSKNGTSMRGAWCWCWC